jgi:hypothetical protein
MIPGARMPGNENLVRARPGPGVTVRVLEDGCLELHAAETGTQYRCSRIGAAMWIALRQHDGRCDAAADMLAELWGTDPVNMRADIEVWIAEMCDAGLMRLVP